MKVAVVDMGSNSLHLQVVESGPQGRTTLHTARAAVRLGDLDQGRLRPQAMQAAVTALLEFQTKAQSLGASLHTVSATAALRDASNGHELAHLLAPHRLQLEVLSGTDEATLIYKGACAALDLDAALVIDLGGRSTEFALGHGAQLQELLSLNVGHISAAQQPDDARVAWCRRGLSGASQFFARDLPPVVLTAGTALTLGRMALVAAGLSSPADPVQGRAVPRLALERCIREVLQHPDPTSLPGSDPRRADTLKAGALALGCILEGLTAETLLLSRAALREGLVERALES